MGKRVPLEKRTIGQLKGLLDKEVSTWVRNYWSEDGENAQCFTCNIVKPIKQMHCGHYIPRNISPTRYQVGAEIDNTDCPNLAPQCPQCNTFRHGMGFEYRANLVKLVGSEPVEVMEEKARQPWKWDKLELLTKIALFRSENKQWAV
tara:strand:- start:128 stop:568 length:441 start_codon:yes stop_codon:yes gene_type:complete